MDKLPLGLYDVLGYLAPGCVLLLTANVVFGLPAIIGQDLTTWDSVALLLMMYIVGHVAATPSQSLLERYIVGQILGRPQVRLLVEPEPPEPAARLQRFLGGYMECLPQPIRDRIFARAQREGLTVSPESISREDQSLFLHVRFHPAILASASLERRLETFVSAYGFARNMTFAALVASVALLVTAGLSRGRAVAVGPAHTVSPLALALCAFLLAVGLFYRYLKTHRQYSYELFNAYASFEPVPPAAKGEAAE